MRSALLAAALACGLALIFTAQALVTAAVGGRDLRPAHAFATQLIPWAVWACLSPVILWASRRVHAAHLPVRRVALCHVAFAVLSSLLHVLLTAVPTAYAMGWFPDRLTWGEVLRALLVNRGATSLLDYAALVIAWHALVYRRELAGKELAAARLAQSLAESELRELRSQLQPHFLSNSLNAIASYVREDPASAEEMILRLNRFLRRVLRVSREHEVRVEEELALAREYLCIHEMRFGPRLTVSVHVGPDADGALVPVMLLQPLVENALSHGIGARPGPGRIELSVERHGESLSVTVTDRAAAPRHASRVDEIGGSGIGLANTRARLERLFGTSWDMCIEPLGRRGTRVRVTIPFRRTPESPRAPRHE